MWRRLWLAFSVSAVCSQYTNTKVSHNGATFGWGWRLSPTGVAESTIGQYYLQLPESEQQVQYLPGNTYHGAHSNGQDMLQAHSFTLGHRLQEINNQNVYKLPQLNSSQIPATHLNTQPVDIFLLQQQYMPYTQAEPVLQIPSSVQTTPHYNTDSNNTPSTAIRTDYAFSEAPTAIGNSRPLHGEVINEYGSPVQVFKNHNCTKTNGTMSKDLQNDMKKSQELFAESHHLHNTDNVATSLPQSYTYRAAVKFRVETPKPNARMERFYYTTVKTPTYENTTLDGIDKLVASTQDLISNEDLLFINDAAERNVYEEFEDIKPRSVSKNNETHRENIKKHITVRAKIENIVNGNIQHLQNDLTDQHILQSDSNKYNFAAPIIVSENSYNNIRDQVVDNLVSTMVPYIANGYQIVGVKETLDDIHQNNQNSKIVNVTPRPVNQNYLAPITVALRLINANETETFNTVEDHETSDSEFISDTVRSPAKGKTIVEIQKSIPVEITHINDVEVHEYIDFDEGRSNNKGPFDVAKSLYNKYVEALKSKKILDNMNKLFHQHRIIKQESNENNEGNDSDHIEPSENIQSEVEVKPNEDSKTQRSEHIQYYDSYGDDNQKIIQPIIIEKEVPVTKFVDRFIEKKVPYPQHIEVPVPVDRPYPVEVPIEKIVEKPIEVTKYVDKHYPVEVPRPYPVEIKVPYPVEQKVYVDRPVHVPYPVEKLVEKQVIQPVAVPSPVGIPIGVPYPVEHKILYPVPVDRPVPVEIEKPVETIIHKEVPVPYAVEKKVPYPVHYETRVPVPYPVEKRIPVPVERIVEKPVTVTKFVDRPVHIKVPVPQPVAVPVHVPQPYPVDRIVEKRVPYPVQVEKIVEKPVQVPYPVEKIVEKIVEKPVIVTKYIDKPYPVEKKVPYPVEKIVEKKAPYPVEVKVPVEVRVPYPVHKVAEKPVHIPVPYIVGYSHSQLHSESKNIPQYETFKDDKAKKAGDRQQGYVSQFQQLPKEKERLKLPVESTRWGNHYASSYHYVTNNTDVKPLEEKIHSNLANYLNYIANSKKASQYYGPVPIPNQDDWWENNKNYVVEVKMRRTDREPKLSNLRIEYGGFKPPLIPSTEVDLDGMPINKQT